MQSRNSLTQIAADPLFQKLESCWSETQIVHCSHLTIQYRRSWVHFLQPPKLWIFEEIQAQGRRRQNHKTRQLKIEQESKQCIEIITILRRWGKDFKFDYEEEETRAKRVERLRRRWKLKRENTVKKCEKKTLTTANNEVTSQASSIEPKAAERLPLSLHKYLTLPARSLHFHFNSTRVNTSLDSRSSFSPRRRHDDTRRKKDHRRQKK